MRLLATAAVALGLIGSSTVTASASSIAQDFLALPTTSDRSGKTINLWFDRPLNTGWDQNFVLQDEGRFTTFTDGSALLTGTVKSLTDPNSGFDMTFTMDSDFNYVPTFKTPWPVTEPSNNKFLDLNGGRLSGFGLLAGLELNIFRFPDPGGAAVQYGGGLTDLVASNLHNKNFGLSTWFAVTDIVSATCAICGEIAIQTLTSAQGDVVFDLAPAPVPVPASGVLMAGALGLAGFGLRRRKA